MSELRVRAVLGVGEIRKGDDLVTALLDAFVNGRVPGIAPLAGYGLLGAGAVLLVAALLRRRNPAAALAETTR